MNEINQPIEEQESRAAKLARVAAHPIDSDIAALHDPSAALEGETP